MDCDDVMLVLANRDRRTLTDAEQGHYHAHLTECDDCRVLAAEGTDWRWIARLPQDALDGPVALVLPTVDPAVFDIDQEIASGGMGRITKASDRRLGREVAIKEVLAPNMRARFEREAMITARLQHPAIVPIYEAGIFPNGNPFYTMRLVWGGTLGGAIQQTKTMAERLALLPHVLAVIDALAYAHSNRIIHRDLKPGNVLIGEFGETVVIDWGLAKELGNTIDDPGAPPSKPSSPNLTRVGSVLGTPGFMSPEQASGGSIDERADVYALGAILYNLLAGVPPYYDKHGEEGSTQIIAAAIDKPPTPIGELAPEAPADLRTIVERAMARAKADRYPSAKEMASELRRFTAGQLIAREYTTRELVARWIRRHKTPVAVAAIAALALAVVVVLAFISVNRSRDAEREERLNAEREQAKATEAQGIAERDRAALLEEQGLRELLAGDSNRALTYLEGAFASRNSPALQYLLAAASNGLAHRHQVLGKAKAIAFNGERVVTVEAQRIATWNGDRLVVKRPLGSDPINEAWFDPTAKLVAIQRPNQIELWDVATGTQRWSSPMAGARIVFDRTGQKSASYAKTTLQIRTLDGEAHTVEAGSHIRDVAFGEKYVVACTQNMLEIRELTKLDRVLRPIPTECLKVAFVGPEEVVIANKNFELQRWSVLDGKRIGTMSGHIAINAIAVSETVRMIATGDATGIVMWQWDGKALGESRDVQGGIDKLAFSPDGKALIGAGADDRVFVWDTASFHLRRAISGGSGSIDGVAIDDTRIAVVAAGNSHVWEMPRGRLLARVASLRTAISGDVWITASAGSVTVRDLEGRDRYQVTGTFKPRELHAKDGLALLVEPNKLSTFDPKVAAPVITPVPNRAAITSNHRFLLELSDKHASVIDAVSGRLETKLDLVERPLSGDVSPDGAFIAFVFPRGLKLWRMTGEQAGFAQLPAEHKYTARFDPTSSVVVLFGLDHPTLLVDAATGNRRELDARSGDGVAFSKHGKRVAIGIGNTVQFWDVTSATRLFSVSSTIKDAYAIDEKGQLFATGSVDGSIRIWDESGRMLDRLVGSQTRITRIEFGIASTLRLASSGGRLIAQSDDEHAILWDVGLDLRSHAEIEVFAQRYSSWKLDGVRLVPR